MQRGAIAIGSVLVAVFLTACGGGSGGGNPPPTITPATPTPCPANDTGTPPNCTPSSTTSASGMLVDDATGQPLSGVNVGLATWIAGATPTPEGTTKPDGTFAFTAPNGHYLLVIGSDSSSDTTRATIHDNVTLAGGTQTLKAPTLPPWPTVTPPPWETNGTYRIGTIDANTELPCLTAYNQQRTQRSLPQVVEDEWLKENSRDSVSYYESGHYGQPGYEQTSATHALTQDTLAGPEGVSECPTTLVLDAFQFAPAKDANDLWFAGYYRNWSPPGDATQGSGVIEFPLDPRYETDASGYPWP